MRRILPLQFELIETAPGNTRLEGSTWYRQCLRPARYWQWWSDRIIHTIHRRVLRHIKHEAELAPTDRREEVPLTFDPAGIDFDIMPAAEKQTAKEKFMNFLEQKNLRITTQRQIIVDTVFSTEEHFTAEQLLEWSRAKDPTISRATVYRTLPLLTESGLVREMDFGKEYKFYDPNYAKHPNHNHIICSDCERIVEFESDKLAKLEDEISQRLGFAVKQQRLQITGSCEELKKAGTCKNKCH